MKQEKEFDLIQMEVLKNPIFDHEMSRDPLLLYVVEGDTGISFESKTVRLKRESIILINSNRSFSLKKRLGSSEDLLLCVLKISKAFLVTYTGKKNLLFWCNSTEEGEGEAYEKLRVILQQLLIDYANNPPEQYLLRYSCFYRLLHQLVSYFIISESNHLVGGSDKDSQSRLNDLIDYIESNYDQPVSLEELAERFHLSGSYVSRYFKQKMGRNFIDYLYETRLYHAAELLLNTDKAITDIALESGFPNLAIFNRRFRGMYNCTPTKYREAHRKQEDRTEEIKANQRERIRTQLQSHFGYSAASGLLPAEKAKAVESVDSSVCGPYHRIWNRTINFGPLVELLKTGSREAVIYTKKVLGIRYLRVWNIFEKEMYIVQNREMGSARFKLLDEALGVLVENDILPVIEIGEKPRRILNSVNDFLRESENVTLFQDYQEFLRCFADMMEHVVRKFGEEAVSQWIFELWDDKRVEVYADKQPYTVLFRDVRNLVKQYSPQSVVSGAGNYLGWYRTHTEEELRKFVDGGIYPEHLTFTHFPYAQGQISKERFSKRKTDESELLHSVQELHGILNMYGLNNRPVVISEWNMTVSSRNYFNDSLWKGCYILKCNLDLLGLVDTLCYSQLSDSTTDYYDNQNLLKGAMGLLTSDHIEKLAFIAMRMLKELKPLLVKKTEDYIVTRDERGEITIVAFHFIRRNHLYYMKEENETTLQDHYIYLEHQQPKTLTIQLTHLAHEGSYLMRQYIVSRKQGSIMDEWQKLAYIEDPSKDDIHYLKQRATPHMTMDKMKTEGQSLVISMEMEPLEMRCIILRPE